MEFLSIQPPGCATPVRSKHDAGKSRSGEICVAQCVSVGNANRIIGSRGAATSNNGTFGNRAPALISTQRRALVCRCRRSAAPQCAIHFPNAHALGYVDCAAPRLKARSFPKGLVYQPVPMLAKLG